MTHKLYLQNIYSWLNTDDEDLKHVLWKALRFKQKNYFHNPLYKKKLWSGHVDFFKKESGRFLTGLLPEIELALRHKNAKYEIVDERKDFDFSIKKIDKNFLNKWSDKALSLYDYQVEYANQIAACKRGIVRLATGAGKTNVLLCALKMLPPKTPTLIMTKSVDLCHQIYDDLMVYKFDNLGKVIGSAKKNFKPNIMTVANVDSVHKIEKLLPLFKACFVDESHLMLSKTPKEVYKRMKSASVRVAFSATPFKFGETDLCQKYESKGFFGPVIKYKGRIISTKELQQRGILSSSKCIFYPIDEPQLPYETYQDAVTLGIAENLHFNNIVARLAKSLKGRTLIIVERVAHGELLNTLIPESHWVYGEDNDEARKKVINLLKGSEKCTCIVQQALISAGINVFVHDMICALGSKATHHIIQRMGRGLRTANDKEGLVYHDFLFSINEYLEKHSYHRIRTLEEEGHDVKICEEIDF